MLGYLIACALLLLAVAGVLFALEMRATAPLGEPTWLGQAAVRVAACAALPVATILAGAL